jgi:hypothetical protein
MMAPPLPGKKEVKLLKSKFLLKQRIKERITAQVFICRRNGGKASG